MKELEIMLKEIRERISDISMRNIPIGLMDGRTGIFLFLSIYSALAESDSDRELSQRLFNLLLKEHAYHDRSFMYGNLGFVWAVRYLVSLEILEESDSLNNELLKILYTTSPHNVSPVYISDSDNFYGEAFATLSFLSTEDSLRRYSFQERLIRIVDDSERMLCMAVPGLYSPDDMKCSFLHSMTSFLLKIRTLKIYPTKAEMLINLIREHSCIKIKEMTFHAAVLHFLLDGTFSDYGLGKDVHYKIKVLASAGLYSLIYEHPDLFDAVRRLAGVDLYDIRAYISSKECSLSDMIGLGFGFLTLVLNEE